MIIKKLKTYINQFIYSVCTLSAFAIANFWFCNVFHFSANAFCLFASDSWVLSTLLTSEKLQWFKRNQRLVELVNLSQIMWCFTFFRNWFSLCHQTNTSESRQIPIMAHFDIIIVGVRSFDVHCFRRVLNFRSAQ